MGDVERDFIRQWHVRAGTWGREKKPEIGSQCIQAGIEAMRTDESRGGSVQRSGEPVFEEEVRKEEPAEETRNQ